MRVLRGLHLIGHNIRNILLTPEFGGLCRLEVLKIGKMRFCLK